MKISKLPGDIRAEIEEHTSDLLRFISANRSTYDVDVTDITSKFFPSRGSYYAFDIDDLEFDEFVTTINDIFEIVGSKFPHRIAVDNYSLRKWYDYFESSKDKILANINKVPHQYRTTPHTATEKVVRIHVDAILNRIRDQNSHLIQINTLRHRLPAEKPAPIRISVRDNRLELANSKHHDGSLQPGSVERLRRAASDILRRAINTMRAADNIDRRVVPACEPLLNELEADYETFSVESLGLNWEVVSTLAEQFDDAIPEIALIHLREALKTINVILNQFEEWRAYLSAKEIVKIPEDEINSVVSIVASIADDLSERTEIVDPKIEQRLREITKPIDSGLVDVHAVVPALIDSLSNIFAALSKEMMDHGIHLEAAAKAASSHPTTTNALLLFSIGLISKYAPRLGHIKPFAFMRDAHELLTTQFSWLKDLLPK
jgi:hypothetical protein